MSVLEKEHLDICVDFLQQSRQRVNTCLHAFLQQQQSPYAEANEPRLQRLKEASYYSVSNGGKRLRPALVYATADTLGVGHLTHDLDLLAAAIECIHSYSLVHDDLPAMDDDDLRRGKATCHIAYDEATAILVGDGLQAFAFELVCQCQQISAPQKLAIISHLAQAAGNFGMVGGQAIDLESENTHPDLQQLEQMHSLKTGALIRSAVAIAAIAASADAQQIKALDEYANAIGLAFQVQDDILDIESDTETLGKPQGADVKLNKATYPALLGISAAKDKAQKLVSTAQRVLQPLAKDTKVLEALADFIIYRQH